jgi:Tol biopolymer transport system component/DNA-binding winged helix-turn-helix (wHTH) protein
MREQNYYVYEFGPFHLDATRRVLLKEGEPLKLFPKEFDTLLALVEHSGEVLAKDDLIRQVWQDVIVEEGNLTTNISHLRKVLGETRDRHDYIVTVPGQGYRFVAGVRQAFDEVMVRERTRVTVEQEEETEGAERSREYPTPLARRNGDSAGTQLAATRETSHDANVGIVNPEQFAVHAATAAKLAVRAPVTARSRIWFSLGVAVVSISLSAFLFSRFLRAKAPPPPFQDVTLKQLTTNSKTSLATLSPDAKLFAYVSRIAGQESLWLGHVSGGEPIALRPAAEVTYRSLTFSSDGGSLYYVAISDQIPRGALFRMPVFGGVPEKLHDNVGVRVAFAPDMRQFAFARWRAAEKRSSVVIADTEGPGGEREIASRPEDVPFGVASPSWSPDGSMIAVAAATDTSGERSELFLVSVTDASIKPLTSLAWSYIASTVWLPDGSGLVMVAKQRGVLDYQLWHISYYDGSARRILSDLDTYGSALSFSADGKSLLAAQEQRINNVWIAPAADFTQAKQVTFSAIGRRDGWGNLEWTPEGKLLYGAITDNSLSIWTMGADGGDQKQLTSPGHWDSNVSMTPDGRYMVFSSNRSGSYEIWRSHLDGSDVKQLTSGGDNREPHVTPDGTWVIYTSLRGGLRTLWRVAVEGGESVRIADQPASWPRVSPDGRFIACAYHSQLEPERTQLAVMPIAGGPPVKLFDVPRLANFNTGIRWMPDGKAVTYRDWVNGVWKQTLAGGKPERLAGLPEEKLHAYAWSRDGKKFAFVRGSEIRDVILLRNTN